MSFGFGFGFTKITAAIRAAFSPSSLFAANEPGVWYDPSDFSTMFQDAAGTAPVTAAEQPVGLMLDKSKGLVLGPELVTNGTFDTDISGWAISSGTPLPSWSSGRMLFSGNGQTAQAISVVPGKWYQISGDITVTSGTGGFGIGTVSNNATVFWPGYSGTSRTVTASFLATTSTVYAIAATNTISQTYFDNISVRELPGNHAYQTTATSRPVLSARVNQYLATETLATQNVTTLAAQYRLSFEGTGTVTLSGTATGVYSAGSHLITCTAGTLTSTVSGSVTKADLRVANTGVNLPPYQRVNTATDYDTVGFPHYLRFDGVDDWLVTNTITPGIDKVQVFAGVRKLSDAAIGMIVETTTNAGTVGGVALTASGWWLVGGARYGVASKSSDNIDYASGDTAANYASPITNILCSLHDLTALAPQDMTRLRVNSINTSLIFSDTRQGVGGLFPNGQLYIGRRNGTTFPFNGHLYSLIVRFGSNLPAATIENTENYINTKTGAY